MLICVNSFDFISDLARLFSLQHEEAIMSDGGISDGIAFWATINIRGNVPKEKLKEITSGIRKLMADKKVDGEIVHAVRMSATDDPVISISMKPSGD
jgi:hypothetical protein